MAVNFLLQDRMHSFASSLLTRLRTSEPIFFGILRRDNRFMRPYSNGPPCEFIPTLDLISLYGQVLWYRSLGKVTITYNSTMLFSNAKKILFYRFLIVRVKRKERGEKRNKKGKERKMLGISLLAQSSRNQGR